MDSQTISPAAAAIGRTIAGAVSMMVQTGQPSPKMRDAIADLLSLQFELLIVGIEMKVLQRISAGDTVQANVSILNDRLTKLLQASELLSVPNATQGPKPSDG